MFAVDVNNFCLYIVLQVKDEFLVPIKSNTSMGFLLFVTDHTRSLLVCPFRISNEGHITCTVFPLFLDIDL